MEYMKVIEDRDSKRRQKMVDLDIVSVGRTIFVFIHN